MSLLNVLVLPGATHHGTLRGKLHWLWVSVRCVENCVPVGSLGCDLSLADAMIS